MAKVRLNKDPRQMVLARTTGEKVPLECFGGEYWIIPKKLSVDAFQMILETSGLRINQAAANKRLKSEIKGTNIPPEELEEKSREIIREMVTEEVERAATAGEKVLQQNLTESMKVAFLYGVYDHNMYEHVLIMDTQGKPAQDEEGNFLAEENSDGTPKMRKIPWDGKLWDTFKADNSIAIEIFRVVMDFNKGIKKKRSQ
jgi:hypothetical protein